jgi:hypothetical protein
LVIITRSDIAPGYQLVQSAHAIADFAHEHSQVFKQWKADSNSIICLNISNEQKLLKLFDKLSAVTPSSKFYEPDVDAFTSICVLGTPEIRKKLSHLPLSLKKFSNNDVD